MLEEILQILKQYGASHCSSALKRNPQILQWLKENTQQLSNDCNIMERIYTVINGDQSICQLGNQKIFNTLEKGYRFCSTSCDCRRAEQSRKIKEQQSKVSKEERKRRVEKQEETMLKKHGVKNPMHIEEIRNIISEKAKIIQNNPDTREKAKKTNLERRGVEFASQASEVMDKVRATNKRLRGTEYTTHLARNAFKEQTGFNNPFEMTEYQNKADDSMLALYGVKNALQNPEIYQKMIDNVKNTWGVSNVGKSQEIRDRMQKTLQQMHNRDYANQNHISDNAYEILQDKSAFSKLFETMSLREVSILLGLSYDGCRKYCGRHGVILPKSSYETALAAVLEPHCCFKQCDRKTIKPLELDFLIPDHNLAIEFGGLYFHSEKIKDDPRYHLNKLEMTNEKGIRLITIFEDELIEKKEIVISRILNALGKSEKGIYARKSTIRKISNSEAKIFYETHHIQGGGQNGFASYGSFYENELIAAMTFCKSRSKKYNDSIELLRFATDGRNHPGIASRLLSAFVKEHNPTKMHSYADRRWSEGKLYSALGFTHTGNTELDYYYVNLNKRIFREDRRKYQKHMIIDMVPDGKTKTEKEIMKELGFTRVWGCGHMIFEWRFDARMSVTADMV